MKAKCILIFYLCLINISIYSINILFISQAYKQENNFIKDTKKLINEIVNFNPFYHYVEHINFYYLFTNQEICIYNDFNNFDFYSKVFLNLLSKIDSNIKLVIVLIDSHITKAKGGTIGDRDLPIVIITNSAKRRTILHEICHALFNLGDEYEGDIKKLPSNIEISKFRNLSLFNKNSEWDMIKILIGEKNLANYEGGLGRKNGVYRAFKDCTMRSIDKDLCPVCLYYAVNTLNQLTGDQKDFLSIYYNNKFVIKEVSLQQISISSY